MLIPVHQPLLLPLLVVFCHDEVELERMLLVNLVFMLGLLRTFTQNEHCL